LFIGSGFSIRYARTPNWEDLLKEMANLCPRIDKNFAYYKQIHNKDYIRISTLFADSYRDWAWNLTFPVKSKIQQCKLLEALSGKGLRNDSLDRKKNILKPSSRLSFKFQKQRMKGV